jgi:hypothetical protein
MKRQFLIAVCASALLSVTGCATQKPFGSFLSGSASAPVDGLAHDVARKMAATWLPAKTRVSLQHPTADEFGAALVASLRTQGYSVLEYTPPDKAQAAAPAESNAPPPQQTANEPVAVSYVLDHAGEFYRLKLLAGGQILSRAYVVNAGQFAPAGAWSLLKE